MPLTPEQRSAINRQNARKSTGPKSDAGKERSRMNAVKHGMRAEVLILPDEDPAAIAARHQEWNDYYDPQSPAAQHLLNQCVRATLLADRVDRQHHDAISKQVREAQEAWDRAQVDQVEELKAIFGSDPARATRLLRRSSLGCSWMIECWERLAESLRERGGWEPFEQAEAFRLMGDHPFAGPMPKPDPVILRMLAAQQLDQLRAERDRLWNDLEAPDRAEAPGRALILRDPSDARLFLRYHAEARCTFHRAWRDLTKTLESDATAAELAEAAGATSPNEANRAPIASPNEANRAPAFAPAAIGPASPNEANRAPVAADAPVSPNEANATAGADPAGSSRPEAGAARVSPNEANRAAQTTMSLGDRVAGRAVAGGATHSPNEANLATGAVAAFAPDGADPGAEGPAFEIGREGGDPFKSPPRNADGPR